MCNTSDKVATIDRKSNSSAHSEAELHVLCNTWKKKCSNLEIHCNCHNKKYVDLRASIGQSSKMITRGSLIRLNTIKPSQLHCRTLSNDTYSTAEGTFDASSSRTSLSAEKNDVFTTGVTSYQPSENFCGEIPAMEMWTTLILMAFTLVRWNASQNYLTG